MNGHEKIAHANECKCLPCQPIFAGALVAIGLGFLLNLFSAAIGVTAFTTSSDGAENLILGGLIATGLAIVVSMFASGWLCGFLSQRYCYKRHLGALYGFLTWCVALIISVLLAGYIHEYLSYYTHFLSGTTEVMNATHVAPGSTMAKVANTSEAKKLVVSAYIMFSLFFLSAFACSLGGHCGARFVCNKTEGDRDGCH
jgi:hypothetical protein